MAEPKTYHEQSYIDNTIKLREVLQTMPSFTKDYFRAIEADYFGAHAYFLCL